MQRRIGRDSGIAQEDKAVDAFVGFLKRDLQLRLKLVARTALPGRAIVRTCGIRCAPQMTGGLLRLWGLWEFPAESDHCECELARPFNQVVRRHRRMRCRRSAATGAPKNLEQWNGRRESVRNVQRRLNQ